MGADWVLDIESNIFSKVRGRTMGKLIRLFPKIRYTTNNENVEPITVFPTVYMHELQQTTIGDDLQATSVNGIVSTFEVKVTINTEKEDCVAVMREIYKAFIDLRYRPTMNPITSTSNNMYISVARFRRTIGADDTVDFIN